MLDLNLSIFEKSTFLETKKSALFQLLQLSHYQSVSIRPAKSTTKSKRIQGNRRCSPAMFRSIL